MKIDAVRLDEDKDHWRKILGDATSSNGGRHETFIVRKAELQNQLFGLVSERSKKNESAGCPRHQRAISHVFCVCVFFELRRRDAGTRARFRRRNFEGT